MLRKRGLYLNPTFNSTFSNVPYKSQKGSELAWGPEGQYSSSDNVSDRGVWRRLKQYLPFHLLFW
jgi:hypothetical protein